MKSFPVQTRGRDGACRGGRRGQPCGGLQTHIPSVRFPFILSHPPVPEERCTGALHSDTFSIPRARSRIVDTVANTWDLTRRFDGVPGHARARGLGQAVFVTG